MEQKKIKYYNLNCKKPQVLLVGNGLVYQNDFSWDNFIKKISKESKPDTLTDGIPYSIKATTIANVSDKTRHNDYCKAFSEYKYSSFDNLNQLLKIPFDSILTTNYTYEIENHLYKNYYLLSNETKRKKSICTAKKSEAKYLLRTYNRLSRGVQTHDIWHIHGEIRRKSSIILTHDEYARLTKNILEYLDKIRNSYDEYYEDVKFKSWIDYFIMGDIYIVGLGLDFSEFDLWWLLNRRMRENAKIGNIYFYEPKSEQSEAKISVLECMGVKCENFSMLKPSKDNELTAFYDEFYKKVIVDINQKVSHQKEHFK